jgi:diguanylate cyclase (GGDEF)-like protein
MWNAQFLRQHWKSIAIWPGIALALIFLMWQLVLSGEQEEKEQVREQAYQRAIARTSAYALQIQRSIQQIDQTTQLIQYEWYRNEGNVNLAELQAHGVFPPQAFHVTIADPYGNVISSTLSAKNTANFASHEWFQHHRVNPSSDLYIDHKDTSLRTGQPIVRFSRRLEHPDGGFAGVIWVSVDPPYLTTFYDGKYLAEGEFISLRRASGALLASRTGASKASTPVFYKGSPIFPTDKNIAEEPADKFVDGQSRIVAWQHLAPYPLVAIAALTEKEVYGTYLASVRDTRRLATAATLALLFFGATGARYAARLARRNQWEEETKTIFRLAVDGLREGFYIVRPRNKQVRAVQDFYLIDCNERGAELLGYTKRQIIGWKYGDVHGDESYRCEQDFLLRAMTMPFYEDEWRVPAASRVRAEWVHRKAVRYGAGLAITIRDISDTKAHEQALVTIANADSLTGLPNRHWLNQYMPSAIDHAQHYHVGLAVLFLDLDNFKNINDTLGHAAGDLVLKTAAERLRGLVRHGDHVVRLGGDEFTIILEQVHHTEDVSRIAEQIIAEMGKPFPFGPENISQINASVGISQFPQDGMDSETLLKHADIAMYAAKAAGKACYHFYQPHLSEEIVLRVHKEQAIRQAIERDEFLLYYQPRADTFTGRLCSMEALVRWAHPERGVVSPAEFIDVAEETGLILKIGEQVIVKACRQLAEWRAQGLPLVSISVNVSVPQFGQGRIKELLASCLAQYRIDPALLGVEVTESCMVADDTTVPQEINSLRELGVALLIDDFGTGYSSLSQLQKLDFDLLKVDQAFTRQLDISDEGKAFFKAIVSIGQALDMKIVAEGVENADQLRILQELACHEVQGYYVSRPLPAHDVPALLKKIFLFPSQPKSRSAM